MIVKSIWKENFMQTPIKFQSQEQVFFLFINTGRIKQVNEYISNKRINEKID